MLNQNKLSHFIPFVFHSNELMKCILHVKMMWNLNEITIVMHYRCSGAIELLNSRIWTNHYFLLSTIGKTS